MGGLFERFGCTFKNESLSDESVQEEKKCLKTKQDLKNLENTKNLL